MRSEPTATPPPAITQLADQYRAHAKGWHRRAILASHQPAEADAALALQADWAALADLCDDIAGAEHEPNIEAPLAANQAAPSSAPTAPHHPPTAPRSPDVAYDRTAADAIRDATDARERIAAVLAIHRPANDWSWQTFGCTHDGQHRQLCRECHTCYPCKTVAALKGADDHAAA